MHLFRYSILLIALAIGLFVPCRAQDSVYFDNASTVYVDGINHPSGIIFDNGGPNGQYSNNFAGMVIITARYGDTIELSGNYTTEWTNDNLTIYDGNGRYGTLLGTYSGVGTLHLYSQTGYMTLYFSTNVLFNRAGFALNYTIHPNHCANYIDNFTYTDLTATSATLTWLCSDTTGPFRLTYGSVDTTFTSSTFSVQHLSPNSDYTLHLSSIYDTGQSDCLRTLQLHTPCFSAFIRGNHPICDHDTVVLTADSADSYLWSTGDTTRSISVSTEGLYSLIVTTAHACADTDQVRVAKRHIGMELSTPTALCPGDSALIRIGLGSDATIRVLRPQSFQSESERIFLPDGIACNSLGCSYRSPLVFRDFDDDAQITNVNDIRYVMLNIEHSYAADIYINITCPNNQRADILRYGGSGNSDCNSSIGLSSRGWQPGSNASPSTNFGLAVDAIDNFNECDSSTVLNSPGTGWRYCWSNASDAGYTYASGDGLIYRSGNTHFSTFDSSNVLLGTHFYHPDQSFASLVGCPMNGTWYIEVIDGWSGDNGYIFGWTLALNPDRLIRDDYVPSVAYADLLGPWSSRLTDTTFRLIAPPNLLSDTTVLYTVHIFDSTGCQFDTTFSVLFRASQLLVVSDTVAENNLPVTYQGLQFLTDTADVLIPLPGSSLCDSSILYSLHVLHNTFSSLSDTICHSQLPYRWGDLLFQSAGTLTDTLPNAAGADSIVTHSLTVLPDYNADLYDTICNNHTYPYADTLYTTSGHYTHLYHTHTTPACDSTITLHLTVRDTSVADTSVLACDRFEWHGRQYTASTVDTLSGLLTNAAGCDSTLILRLSLRASTAAAYADTCLENQLPRTFHSLTLHSDTSRALVTIPNAVGCDSLITYSLHVFRNTHTQFDTTVCDNHLPLLWRGIVFSQSGTHTDTLSTLHGADSIVSHSLHTHPTYLLSLHDTICQGSSYPFAHTTLTLPGQYVDSLASIHQCDSIVQLSLALLDTIHFRLHHDYTCLFPAHHLVSVDSSSGKAYRWTSVPPDPDLTAQQHASIIQVNPDVPTTYHLTVSHASTALCAATDSLVLHPIVPLHIDCEFIPSGQQIEAINHSTGHTQQTWYINGQPSPNHSPRIVYYSDSQTDSVLFTLIISNDFCADTLTQSVKFAHSALYFPNVFTPGQDRNNRFSAIGTGILEYELWIYDRRGVEQFHTTDFHQGWDGTANGCPCPQAAYVYFCRYRDHNSGAGYLTATGTVLLLR